MKKKYSVDKAVKKSYKKFKSSRFFIPVVVILVLTFVVYIFIPEKESKPRVVTDETGTEYSISYAIPSSPYKEQIVEHKAYTLGYNEDKEQADWVAYVLTRSNLLNPESSRTEDFREDFSVLTGSSTLDDYRGSGYDRGHLAPAADFKWNDAVMSETFYMSNMSPQEKDFNRGIWADLESAVRSNAFDSGVLYVTTGPVFYPDKPIKRIGKNRVAVPHAYYKALAVNTDKEQKAIGFLLPNEGSNKSIRDYAMSVDELENITGFDFFPLLDDDVENRIERSYNAYDWNFSPFRSPTKEEIESGTYVPPSRYDDTSFSETASALRNIKRAIRTALGLK